MATMTLGEFRQLTKDLKDDALITMHINSDFIVKYVNYHVNDYEFEFDYPTDDKHPIGIILRHQELTK